MKQNEQSIEQIQSEHPATSYELSVDQVLAQVQKIQGVMSKAMKEDTHYGTIPGTPKPTLYKPGAEKLCLMFRLCPGYEVLPNTIQRDDLISYAINCTLYHIPTGRLVASGLGSCNSRESKYRWRQGKRSCPECGEEAVIKGKEEYGGGWLCFAKKGGCGQKWPDGAQAIEGQEVGRIENDNPWDLDNTLFKMACKRALIAAALNATAASDIFTQDLEDMRGDEQQGNGQEDTRTATPPTTQRQEPKGNNAVPTLDEKQLEYLGEVATNGKLSDEDVINVLGSHSYTTREEVKQSDLKKILDDLETLAKLRQKQEEQGVTA